MDAVQWTILTIAVLGAAILLVHQVGHAAGVNAALLGEYERMLREARDRPSAAGQTPPGPTAKPPAA